jgi:PP-loop superfamily ATP-utilizing enzyme
MPKYTVRVREVHVAYHEIEADNPETAMNKVQGGDGELVNTEYSHTLDSDTWDVEDEKGDIVGDQR